MTGQELSEQELKVITVQALKDASEGIAELKDNIEECSDRFEEGNDSCGIAGLGMLTEKLQEFAEFCGAIMKNCSVWVPADLSAELINLGAIFEKVLNEVIQSTADEDYIELADVLRLDLLKLLTEYNAHFSAMAKDLETRL